MSDRTAELRRLAADLRKREAVDDAFLAKDFTDRLVIVDVARDREIPDRVVERLTDHDLYGARRVYDGDAEAYSLAGDIGDAARHHFVDVRTRGSHQSYVVD